MPSSSSMYPWSWLASLLSIIGALNWGFVGLFNFNLVRSLFGPMTWLSRLVYSLVGISGLFLLLSYWSTYNQRESGRRGWFS
ncbi:MAG: DUF378 domain-containing protein [Chloroflexi bacterium]|nr:DUF378 domain-containing protein [Chloroflexota bacterium]